MKTIVILFALLCAACVAGEDIAEKRYKRTSEIKQCPLWWANDGCYYGTCMFHLSSDRGNYCCHPAARRKENEDDVQD